MHKTRQIKVSPTVVPDYCHENFQAMAQGEETQHQTDWKRQSSQSREARETTHRTENLTGKLNRETILEINRRFPQIISKTLASACIWGYFLQQRETLSKRIRRNSAQRSYNVRTSAHSKSRKGSSIIHGHWIEYPDGVCFRKEE